MTNNKSGSGSVRKKSVYSAQFKLERAIEVLRTDNVLEISRKYNINSNVLYLWRNQLLERGVTVYESGPDKVVAGLKSQVSKLEQMLGKKEVELNLLKNFSDFYSSGNQS